MWDQSKEARIARFMRRVRVDKNGCWIWTGGKRGRGYGLVKVHGRQCSAHRIGYELFKEPIPDGLFACHKCDVIICVNPEHIFLGTQNDNVQDCKKKGRIRYLEGAAHGNAYLSTSEIEDIREVRAKTNLVLTDIARLFGTSRSNVHLITSGVTRKKS